MNELAEAIAHGVRCHTCGQRAAELCSFFVTSSAKADTVLRTPGVHCELCARLRDQSPRRGASCDLHEDCGQADAAGVLRGEGHVAHRCPGLVP